MRYIKFYISIAALAAAVSCAKGTEDIRPSGEDGLVTIHACLDDSEEGAAPLRSGASPRKGISWTWAAGDRLTIKGATSQVFTIKDGFQPKKADFEGVAVSGESFSIFYPSDNIAVSEWNTQTQDGNDSMDHLVYQACLQDVDTYSTFAFTDAWALDHDGELRQTGVLQMSMILPATVTKVNGLTLSAADPIFYSGNDGTMTDTLRLAFVNANIGSDHKLTANMTTAWYDVPLPGGTVLSAGIDTGEKLYTMSFTIQNDTGIMTGALNTITLKNNDWIEAGEGGGDYAAGKGTEEDPWVITTRAHMLRIKEDLASGSTKYYRMAADVDMGGTEWTPLNAVEPYDKAVCFDGGGHTLGKLGAPLFQSLDGTVKNLVISNASVAGGSEITGILACRNVAGSCTVSNVQIVGSSVSSSSYTGGLIGQIDNPATAAIDNVTVSGTSVGGTLAGGVVGFANALVTMTACTYTGGTVTATGRYSGGMLGSTGKYSSVISGCSVENATIDASAVTADARSGGFIGQLQVGVTIKGCTVGTETKKVTVKLAKPSSTSKVLNAGGFIGVCYGTITKDGSIRSKAYASIVCANTETGGRLNVGGFAGYHTGVIEYSDAVVAMDAIKGTHIGGFAGYMYTEASRISDCTSQGSVSGNNYCGGFVGFVDTGNPTLSGNTSGGSLSGQSSVGGFAGGSASGTFTGNSSSVTVNSSGNNCGGFIGSAIGTFTYNHASGNVISEGSSNGGFAGQVADSGSATMTCNYATGNISGTSNCGGFLGYAGGNLTLSDCYATGNVGNSTKYNQKYGGLVGYTTDAATAKTITISNCFATGKVEGSFGAGGLVGRIGQPTCTVSRCAAWGPSVFAHTTGSGNWSSAAVVGVAYPTCTLTDNYRRPDMELTAWWVPDMASFQHANVSPYNPLLDKDGSPMTDTATASGQPHYPLYPYHGKVESGKTLSALASGTLGWSADTWDFSTDIPKLK